MIQILLIDDQESVLTSLSILLKRHGYHVDCGRNLSDAKKFLNRKSFDLIITDLRMGNPLEGMQVLQVALEMNPTVPVIIMTGYATIENAVEAMKLGAYDYITKGFTNKEFIEKVSSALSLKKTDLRPETSDMERPKGFDDIIGKSPEIMRVLRLVEKVAPSDSSVLIQGESGTGKELIAKAIHRLSNRKHQSFVAVNCAAFTETLLETELFGHVKGSFTGAEKDKRGLFLAADKGTLFLDEVSEMPLSMQIKLLRVLQEHVIRPVGSTDSIPVDVRIISSTNRDLSKEIFEGNFREDLFFRLCVVPVHLPSLRERKEDIPVLAKHFINILGKKQNKMPLILESEVLKVLSNQTWRGNIRELQNFLERLVLLADNTVVSVNDVLRFLPSESPGDLTPSGSLAEKERDHILRVLEENQWNQSLAARSLGIGRTTLWRKMKTYGITPE
ncbi:MAG TPA: sigma-54 dependent transcriptional regulator [Desulfobacteraceae bacterium]|nr:sigma-54 dependent transcriptional regulator [Desulfobacteraceae bacterium]HPJ68790.1 sigma-54 dependent transcriptional regulator [Desulfobacteraceae bacterium]HPQ28870.1 sigma-54 dependent transcriptional regulator [Desulfobacteraceae bacterium]